MRLIEDFALVYSDEWDENAREMLRQALEECETYKGRPVLTENVRRMMPCPFPEEPEWQQK